MSDDEDIDSMWGTLRPKKPAPPPDPTWIDKIRGAAKLTASSKEGRPSTTFTAPVEVALFTPQGEVSARDYRRARTTLEIDGERATLGDVEFAEAISDWGFVMTLGVCLASEGAPTFYLDLKNPMRIRNSLSLSLSCVEVHEKTGELFATVLNSEPMGHNDEIDGEIDGEDATGAEVVDRLNTLFRSLAWRRMPRTSRD